MLQAARRWPYQWLPRSPRALTPDPRTPPSAVELDRQVLAVSDWTDLPLDPASPGTVVGVCLTVCDPVRQPLHDRLLELNHQRHAEEGGDNAAGPKAPLQRSLF